MSYMKSLATPDEPSGSTLDRVVADMKWRQRKYERERLERLAWEAERALADYFAAVRAFEAARNEDAGRRASADFEAGRLPF